MDGNKAIVVRYLEEAWNKGFVDVIDELMAPSFTYSDWMHVEGDRDYLKQKIVMLRGMSQDFHATVQEIIAEGNTVAVRFAMNGNLEGKHLTSNGAMIAHIADEKITDYWYLDKEVVPVQQPT